MLKVLRSVQRVAPALALGLMLALVLPACQTINMDCADGSPGGATGCGIPRPVNPGVTKAEGQICNTGSTCRIENLSPCDITNPSSKCTSKNNAGACECKCL